MFLRHHILGHFGIKLPAANAIAQGDRDRFLSVGLPDYVFVQFADDFARRQLVQYRLVLGGLRGQM